MRTFTKKRGFFAVAATLLIVTVMLVTTWCSNDIGDESTDNFTLPPGKGAIRINFNKDIARSITIPSDADITIFDQFLFTFTPKSPGGIAINRTVSKANLYDLIILDAGTYDLIVIAYIKDSSNNMQPAAVNKTANEVIINPGTTIDDTITLEVYDPDGTIDGIFSYTLELGTPLITFSGNDTAIMTLTKIGESSAALTKNIIAEFDNTPKKVNVASGYYYLDFTLKVKGDTVNFRHVVHIYQGMTSSYKFTISMNYFGAGFQLEVGEIIFDPPADLKPALECDIDASASPTPVDDGDNVPLTKGHDLYITVVNASDYDSFEWYCLSTESLEASDTFVMRATNSNDPFYYARDYSIIVVCTKDGIKYASTLIVSVY